jgi:hypothetical protein
MENSNDKYQSEQTVKSSKEYEAPKMNEDTNSKNQKLQVGKSDNNNNGRNAENGEDNGFFNEEKQAEENADRNESEMNQ